ncbi:MAG: ABC transporter substrate-binding protein [Alphaproteobacteria bacterium]|nr:ABC transporter substrate-binding protein [Alphaproteobacteria bacterium]
MRRRALVAGIGATAGWSRATVAQTSQLPVVGLLSAASADAPSGPIEAIHLALKQAGLEIDRAVRMEYRFADNEPGRLPQLAAELVRIPAAVIIALGGPGSALAAKAATGTIPIVFAPVSEPVRGGLVASLNRPGGNITGIAALTIELDPKRLELLHELAPPGPLGVLVNPNRPDLQLQLEGIEAAALPLGRQLAIVHAGTSDAMASAFATLQGRSIVGLLVGADAFFSSQRNAIVALAARHGWPAIYQWREFVDAGGFASYGPNLFESYRQTGIYVARILKGEKPADLPVQQPTNFEFVINMKTARTLGLAVRPALLSRADDVIE